MIETLRRTEKSDACFSLKNRIFRVIWGVFYISLIRFSPAPFRRWRACIYKLFGAKVGKKVNIYPTARVWLPSNLTIGEGSSIGPNVNVYNQGEIIIGRDVVISQFSYLCASTHDYNDPLHPLVMAPITIENHVWICADAFVGPGVYVREGCVIGARAVVTKSTLDWGVYAGNPAKKVKDRATFA
ncbi:MAG: putative colanic acid biosynthesis acetyltransferase [Gammaproteobacteria bacterium]|nr:putative colanic acid biosynthesis acetyltransferase [Gammaproteobacteria bacterium]